jgi:superfamily I DNA/RNA helicase
MVATSQADRYEAAKSHRQRHVDDVVAADARKKIVVAGPGTGKTFLFRKVLDGKAKSLTLTFVNALVEDLSLELFGLSEVRTLHSFARQQLKKVPGQTVRVFSKLSTVIRQDALTLLGSKVDFDALFHSKADGNESIEFYRKRRVYYGHYGFSDMIYAAVRYFEEHPDKIPQYTQVVVDEFQDFNALEVALIDQLASTSPVLIAGDDDQALYETLRCASAGHIRKRHANAATGYQKFALPYCSRCTRVIVEATNDIISGAKSAGHLRDRIEKPFLYFDDPQKDSESERYPSLVYGQVYPKQVPWFIQKHIKEIATEVRHKFSVLVLSPTRTQCRDIQASLRKKGFQNIHYLENQERPEPTLLDGLNLLLEDIKGNLGWRVTAKALLPAADFEPLLAQTRDSDSTPLFCNILPAAVKKEVKSLLRVLRAARKGKWEVDDEHAVEVLKHLGVDPVAMAKEFLRDQLTLSGQPRVEFGIRKINVTVTTIPGSKGLAADYVFITHFDDLYFIKDKDKSLVTDQDVCSFLVALTRARRAVYLVSSKKNKEPLFLKWINKERIRTVG